MADYFLRSLDQTRAYRITYTVRDSDGTIHVESARAVGVAGAKAPDGTDLAGLDTEISLANVLVDQVLGNLEVTDLAGYKTIAKAAIDSRW